MGDLHDISYASLSRAPGLINLTIDKPLEIYLACRQRSDTGALMRKHTKTAQQNAKCSLYNKSILFRHNCEALHWTVAAFYCIFYQHLNNVTVQLTHSFLLIKNQVTLDRLCKYIRCAKTHSSGKVWVKAQWLTAINKYKNKANLIWNKTIFGYGSQKCSLLMGLLCVIWLWHHQKELTQRGLKLSLSCTHSLPQSYPIGLHIEVKEEKW